MANGIAPLVLFTYKRLDTLRAAVKCLQANYLAPQTTLFIYCDGAKTPADADKVQRVQEFCDAVTGFAEVVVRKAAKNQGLANSVKKGVSEVLEVHGRAIVLEDDLETAPNFLDFMNQALTVYQNVPSVFSISGYTFPVDAASHHQDVFFHPRGSSWGWATWQDRWTTVDWKVLSHVDVNTMRRAENMGSDWVSLIKKVKAKTNDSWAIPWIVNQCLQNGSTVYPTVSKVRNIGFDMDATHTQRSGHRFLTPLDASGQRSFRMEAKVTPNKRLVRQFNHRLSYGYRAYSLLYYYYTRMLQQAERMAPRKYQPRPSSFNSQ